MENEVTKKVNNNNNSAKNKSSSKKSTSTKKKNTTTKGKSTGTNKKSAPKKNVSTSTTKKSTSTKSTTSAVKNTNQVKKTNTTKKKTTTKKSNTYQYNKRNLEKKKSEVKKIEEVKKKTDELVDESIHAEIKPEKVINQEKFNFEEEKNTEIIDSILEGIDLRNDTTKNEEELEFTGIINVVDEDNDDKEVIQEFEREIIEDILGEEAAKEILESEVEPEVLDVEPEAEPEVLDVENTEVLKEDISKEFELTEAEEILNEILTEKEKSSIFEEEIVEDILEDKEKNEEFYPFDDEEIELESEVVNKDFDEEIETLDDDHLFKTLRVDLYDAYDRDNDFKEDLVSSKTVESVNDKFLLVDNILTEETRQNIIPDNVFVKEDNSDENEYYM